jgi:hypothetical protein
LSPEKNKTSRPWHNGSVPPYGKFKPIKIGNVFMKLVPLQKHQKKKLRVSELAQPFSSVQFSSESRADQN